NFAANPSGVIEFTSNAKILNSIVKIANINIDMLDDSPTIYEFRQLHSDSSARYAFDVNFSSGEADLISTVKEGSSGVIVVSELNILDENLPNMSSVLVLDTFGDVKLVFDENLVVKNNLGKTINLVSNFVADIPSIVSSDQVFSQEEGVAISSTNYENDSIIYFSGSDYDTLAIITQKIATGRQFNFVGDNLTQGYTVGYKQGLTSQNDLGAQNLNMGSGDLTINGGNSSLNMNGNEFVLSQVDNVLNLQNITINGDKFADVTNRGAVINLKNVTLNAPITSSTLANNEFFNMNITGNSVINSTIFNANVSFKNSSTTANQTDVLLIKNPNAFAINTRLTLNSGLVDLSQSDNSTTTQYNFNYLFSTTSSNFKIDWDILNETSDSIVVNDSSSTGQIFITDVNYLPYTQEQIDNYINSHFSNGEISYIVTLDILNHDTKNIQLRLRDSNPNPKYSDANFVKILKSETSTYNDAIFEYVNATDLFYRQTADITYYGALQLANSSGAYVNDALSFVVTKDVDIISERALLGDSLYYIINDDSVERSREVTFLLGKAESQYAVRKSFPAGTLFVPGDNMVMASQHLKLQGVYKYGNIFTSDLNISDIDLSGSNIIVGTGLDGSAYQNGATLTLSGVRLHSTGLASNGNIIELANSTAYTGQDYKLVISDSYVIGNIATTASSGDTKIKISGSGSTTIDGNFVAPNNGKTIVDLLSGRLYINSRTFDDDNVVFGANGGTVSLTDNTANSSINDYYFNNLCAFGSLFEIDVNLSTGKADTIRSTNNGQGTVIINNINFIGSFNNGTTSKTIRVIHNNWWSSSLELALSDTVLSQINESGYIGERVADRVYKNYTRSVKASDEVLYAKDVVLEKLKGSISLAKSTLENYANRYDSLKIQVKSVENAGYLEQNVLQSTLLKVMNDDFDGERTFDIDSNSIDSITGIATYRVHYLPKDSNAPTLAEDFVYNLGTTKTGTLNITASGATPGGRAVLDAGSHTLFKLTEAGTTLNINSVELVNALNTDGSYMIVGEGNVVNLVNSAIGSVLVQNGEDFVSSGILNAGDINFTGSSKSVLGTSISGYHEVEGRIFVSAGSSLEVVSDSTITQEVLGVSGEFSMLDGLLDINLLNVDSGAKATIAAGVLKSESAAVKGELALQSGTLNSHVTGVGKTSVLGDVVLNSLIETSAIEIVEGGKLTSEIRYLGSPIVNKSELVIVNSDTNNTLATTINADGSQTGVVTVNAALINQEANKVNAEILHILADKSYTTNASDTVASLIINEGVLYLTGGTNRSEITGNIGAMTFAMRSGETPASVGQTVIDGIVTSLVAINQDIIINSNAGLT
ncbi:hypothetical protein IKJ53_05235, partial [bacterium]|nr:hypothetical protein [bacterium]